MSNNSISPTPPRPPSKLWRKVFLYLAVIATWIGLSRVFPLDVWLLNILVWLEGLGFWGLVLFMLLYVPSCVFMFPDILPNAAAGAIWGIGPGFIVVSLGRVLGSAATFLLTRRIGGRWIERTMATDARFAAVSEAVGREGFRIVVLLRLCPLFPVILLNYTLGLTRVSLAAYAAGTLIGMIPRTLLVAYAGSGARSLADLARGEVLHGAMPPVLYWGGLALSLVIVVILAHKARKIINKTLG
jgi:uncharacterized membrane protein YdjX (TVP38/TMEM64 family)